MYTNTIIYSDVYIVVIHKHHRLFHRVRHRHTLKPSPVPPCTPSAYITFYNAPYYISYTNTIIYSAVTPSLYTNTIIYFTMYTIIVHQYHSSIPPCTPSSYTNTIMYSTMYTILVHYILQCHIVSHTPTLSYSVVYTIIVKDKRKICSISAKNKIKKKQDEREKRGERRYVRKQKKN